MVKLQLAMITLDGNEAMKLAAAVADFLIMGTALFQSADMPGTVRSIRESVEGSPRR